MFERFTEPSRRVVVLAQEEARMLGHNHIGTEHLLLGLVHENAGIAAQVLESAGVTIEAARAQVAELAGPGEKSPSGHIPFTQRARKILELSLREALEQHKRYIGPEHILLALMRDPGDLGARILERLGGPLPALRQQVLEAARAAPAPAAEEDGGPEARAWDWSPTQGFMREARLQAQTATALRKQLEPLDRRLANIERHLGIAAEEGAGAGPRWLFTSIDRRVANIERHLGIEPKAAAPEAEEKAVQAEPEADEK